MSKNYPSKVSRDKYGEFQEKLYKNQQDVTHNEENKFHSDYLENIKFYSSYFKGLKRNENLIEIEDYDKFIQFHKHALQLLLALSTVINYKDIQNYILNTLYLDINQNTIEDINKEIFRETGIHYQLNHNTFFPNDINQYFKILINENIYNGVYMKSVIGKMVDGIKTSQLKKFYDIQVEIDETQQQSESRELQISDHKDFISPYLINIRLYDTLIGNFSSFIRNLFAFFILRLCPDLKVEMDWDAYEYKDIYEKNGEELRVYYLTFNFKDLDLKNFIQDINIEISQEKIFEECVNINYFIPYDKLFQLKSMEKYEYLQYNEKTIKMLFSSILIIFIQDLSLSDIVNRNDFKKDGIITILLHDLYQGIINIDNKKLKDDYYKSSEFKRKQEELINSFLLEEDTGKQTQKKSKKKTKKPSSPKKKPPSPKQKTLYIPQPPIKSQLLEEEIQYPEMFHTNRFSRLSKDVKDVSKEYPYVRHFGKEIRDCTNHVVSLGENYPTNKECGIMYNIYKNPKTKVDDKIKYRLKFSNECIDSRCWDEAHCNYLINEANDFKIDLNKEYIIDEKKKTKMSINNYCDKSEQNTKDYGDMLYKKKYGTYYGINTMKTISKGLDNIRHNLGIINKDIDLFIKTYGRNFLNELLEMYNEYMTYIYEDTQDTIINNEVRKLISDPEIEKKINDLVDILNETYDRLGYEEEFIKKVDKSKSKKKSKKKRK
jgi:hypothetical protein